MNIIDNNINQEEALPKARHRDNIELLRRRICLLDGKDKLLMSMYFENGNSCYQIARLLGVCHATISRRIQKLTEHLIGEPFQRYRQYRKQFDSEHKDIARDHFLMALSIHQIASKRKSSFYKVRTTLKEIKAIIKSNPKPPSRQTIFINRKSRRFKDNHGNIQHIKKFQMAGNNNRPCSIRLPDVRSDHRKASGI